MATVGVKEFKEKHSGQVTGKLVKNILKSYCHILSLIRIPSYSERDTLIAIPFVCLSVCLSVRLKEANTISIGFFQKSVALLKSYGITPSMHL